MALFGGIKKNFVKTGANFLQGNLYFEKKTTSSENRDDEHFYQPTLSWQLCATYEKKNLMKVKKC